MRDGDQVVDIGQGLGLEADQCLVDIQRHAGQFAGHLVAQLVVLAHLVFRYQMACAVAHIADRYRCLIGISHCFSPHY